MADISILTPSYNYGRFIADAVRSVIGQPSVRCQHIIQDALSPDDTADVVRSYRDHVHWTSEADHGQSDGLNKALEKATGTWVGWLNADEYYLPGGLATLMSKGVKVGADVVYGDSINVDSLGRMLGLRPQHPFSHRILRLYGPFIPSVSVIIRRSVLDDDPWDPSLKVVMDWDLYLRLAAKGASFCYVPYPVGAFRRHPAQVSSQGPRPETRDVREHYRIPSARAYRKVGMALHRIRKLTAGSYFRQIRARTFSGRSLRWFEEAEGARTFRLVLERCYGRRDEVRTREGKLDEWP